jgi:L-threonylcarbamoyladenylate synthase
MNNLKISQNNLLEIKNFLKNDRILILPTDTVLGLACNAFSSCAIQNLFNLKKRDQNKSFSIFCQKERIKEYAEIKFDWQAKLIEEFIPGEITFLFKAKDQKFLDFGVSKNEKIGIRLPKLEFWIRLFEILNFPLAVTSVNFSGEKPALNFDQINKEILENENVINYFEKKDIIFSSGIPKKLPLFLSEFVS